MRTPAIVLLVALVLAAPWVAEGAPKRPSGGPVVKQINVAGNSALDRDQILSVMRTRESGFLRKKRYREGTLESDLVSVVALYRRHGFLEARAELAEVRYSEDRGSVEIDIVVSEGTQTVVGAVEVEGNRSVATDALKRILAVKAGRPLDDRLLSEDKYAIYSYYADRGFVFAAVSHVLERPGAEAAVRYVIDEGKPAGISQIDVRGSNRVSPKVVRREVTLRPGDVFSRQKVLDSQQRLYDTGMFKDVEIEPSPSGTDSGLVNLLVKIKEKKVREVSAGLGYGTREEARLTLGWLHRNLWNTGRQVEVRTILGSRDFDKGLTRKRADVSLTDRWLFGVRLGGVMSVFFNQTLEEYKQEPGGEYTLDRIGVSLGLQRDISRSTGLNIAYTHEFVDIKELSWQVADPEQLRISLGQEVNRSLALQLERDTRVPFFDPRGGSLTRAQAKTAGGIFGGDNSYNKITLSYARYLAIDRRAVIAVGLKAGHAEAFGQSASDGVPEYERFYVGGSSTVRGYNEREFGPGDFFLVGNFEMRYALVWKLVGVGFFDAGNAWGSVRDVGRSDFDLRVPGDQFAARRDTDCKYSCGFGLGIQTPVGPARVDYGIKLKRGVLESGKKESIGLVHITIGHPF